MFRVYSSADERREPFHRAPVEDATLPCIIPCFGRGIIARGNMLNDVIELLDRRYQSLAKREHVRDFLLHLGPFFDALDREPRIRTHLEDMLADAKRAHEEFNEE